MNALLVAEILGLEVGQRGEILELRVAARVAIRKLTRPGGRKVEHR